MPVISKAVHFVNKLNIEIDKHKHKDFFWGIGGPTKNAYYSNLVKGGGGLALKHREVILKSQIWKIWKWAQSFYTWWLKTFILDTGLFQTALVRI